MFSISHSRILMTLVLTGLVLSPLEGCGDDEITDPGEGALAPSVHIASPPEGAVYTEGDTIRFSGGGEDRSGSALPDSMLVWMSDVDDTLGTGSYLERDDLSTGGHVISLTGTDDEGKSRIEKVSITVMEEQGLVRVPAVSGFPMGWELLYPDEMPVHEVSLGGFEIGMHEVTYALWTRVKGWAESNGYSFASEGLRGGCPVPPCAATDAHPVTSVSWRDCVAWCNAYSEMLGLEPAYYTSQAHAKVYRDPFIGGDIGSDCVDWSASGFRLPTEAEWECAARFIDGVSFSSGAQHSGYDLEDNIDGCAWYGGNSGGSTHPAGQLAQNSLGAWDMSGNVWEWCWDWFAWDYYGQSPGADPRGPETGTMRVVRGGAWANYASDCRTANRLATRPTNIFVDSGFRVCRSFSGM